jgi:hypothetical protein
VVNANIREAHCCYCGGKVVYAVALAIKPYVPAGPTTEQAQQSLPSLTTG